jgi:hypothetical protein
VGYGLQQVGLAETGSAVDEQRVVAACRRLGHREGGGVSEPVGRADHERLEGVPARRQVVGGRVGLRLAEVERDRRFDGWIRRAVDRHLARHDLEHDVEVVVARVFQDGLDQPDVALLDPLSEQLAGHREGQDVVDEVDGGDVAERGRPDGLADLLLQGLRGGAPHIFCFDAHGSHPPCTQVIHRCIHILWKTLLNAQSGRIGGLRR